METERSKELREYLQKTLNLPSAFPEPEEDPEFYVKVYAGLNQFQEKMLDALQSAYPDAESLRSLIKQKLGEDFAKITDGKSYVLYLQNTIEWMESNGCLLEFIAAAHSIKMQNPKLNLFVRKTLLTVVKPLIAPQQVLQSEFALPSLTPTPLAKGSNGRTNNHDTEKSNGKTARMKKAKGTTQSPPEVGQDHVQAPLTPFPYLIASNDKQSSESPTALARGRTNTAQEKMQSVYEMFQKGEKISDTQIVASIRDAKEIINGISAIFDNIPIPDRPELDYMFACEEKYIYGRISAILAYALQGTHMNPPPSNFQKADKEFKKIFSGLQKLETFIVEYEQQIQLRNRINESLLGNGS